MFRLWHHYCDYTCRCSSCWIFSSSSARISTKFWINKKVFLIVVLLSFLFYYFNFNPLLAILICNCSPFDALSEAFMKTDVAFRDEIHSQRRSKGIIQKDWHPGCTAVAALIVGNKLFVANAGDCRAILCRAGRSIALSKVSKDSVINKLHNLNCNGLAQILFCFIFFGTHLRVLI